MAGDESVRDVEPWVGVPIVAEHLDKTPFTVRELAKSGAIPGTKIGSEWRFKLSLIDAFLTKPEPDVFAQSNKSRGRRRLGG
jgi:excisionase family DNA binding protein